MEDPFRKLKAVDLVTAIVCHEVGLVGLRVQRQDLVQHTQTQAIDRRRLLVATVHQTNGHEYPEQTDTVNPSDVQIAMAVHWVPPFESFIFNLKSRKMSRASLYKPLTDPFFYDIFLSLINPDLLSGSWLEKRRPPVNLIFN